MEICPKDYCVFIASHQSKKERIPFLIQCLESIIYQTMRVSTYLSISFENEDLEIHAKEQINKLHDICSFLNVTYQPTKTAQMKHYQYLSDQFGKNHKWILFCDDDDTYDVNRINHYAYYLTNATQKLNEDLILAGIYESLDKDHKQQRQEYWTYCVSSTLLKEFYDILLPHENIINNRCCDVLFSEYLRRKDNHYRFLQVKTKYYNYRVEDNSDSITGFIRSKQGVYTLTSKPPENPEELTEYTKTWETFIKSNVNVFLHDTFLKTLVGYDMEKIFETEFLHNCVLLNSIEREPIEKMTQLHTDLREICDTLYDIKL
jgi:hypothetical protein